MESRVVEERLPVVDGGTPPINPRFTGFINLPFISPSIFVRPSLAYLASLAMAYMFTAL